MKDMNATSFRYSDKMSRDKTDEYEMKSVLIDDDEELDRLQSLENGQNKTNSNKIMTAGCTDEMGNGDNAHNRRKNKTKWVQLPLGDIALTYKSNSKRPSSQVGKPDHTSETLFNAWKAKKGSDLFSKKEMHMRMEEQPTLNGGQLEADNVDSTFLVYEKKQKEDNEMLQKVLQESLRTAQEDARRKLLADIASISEDEKVSDDHDVKNNIVGSENTDHQKQPVEGKHATANDAGGTDFLLKRKTFASYPVKQDTRLLSKPKGKHIPSDRNASRHSSDETASDKEQLVTENRRINGYRNFKNDNYAYRNRNAGGNFGSGRQLKREEGNGVKRSNSSEDSVKVVMSRPKSNCEQDNRRLANKHSTENLSLFKQKKNSCTTFTSYEFSQKNRSDESSDAQNVKVNACQLLSPMDKSLGKPQFNTVVGQLQEDEKLPDSEHFVTPIENVIPCVSINECNKDVKNEAMTSQSDSKSTSVEICESLRTVYVSPSALNIPHQTLISSVWSSLIPDKGSVSETVVPSIYPAPCVQVTDDSQVPVMRSSWCADASSDGNLTINDAYRGEFREIVKDFLKAKENVILEFLSSRFIAEKMIHNQSTDVNGTSLGEQSAGCCFATDQSGYCPVALPPGYMPSTARAQPNQVPTVEQESEFINGNRREKMKQMVKQAIAEYPDIKKMLLDENEDASIRDQQTYDLGLSQNSQNNLPVDDFSSSRTCQLSYAAPSFVPQQIRMVLPGNLHSTPTPHLLSRMSTLQPDPEASLPSQHQELQFVPQISSMQLPHTRHLLSPQPPFVSVFQQPQFVPRAHAPPPFLQPSAAGSPQDQCALQLPETVCDAKRSEYPYMEQQPYGWPVDVQQMAGSDINGNVTNKQMCLQSKTPNDGQQVEHDQLPVVTLSDDKLEADKELITREHGNRVASYETNNRQNLQEERTVLSVDVRQNPKAKGFSYNNDSRPIRGQTDEAGVWSLPGFHSAPRRQQQQQAPLTARGRGRLEL